MHLLHHNIYTVQIHLAAALSTPADPPVLTGASTTAADSFSAPAAYL